MNVLVVGGAGYIGSHTVKRLKEAGHQAVIYDDLSRGHRRVAEILKVPAVYDPIQDRAALRQALAEYRIEAVIHFAAFAYVGESVQKPLEYYQNNVCATLDLLEAMRECDVHTLVFSSTCATYGNPDRVPITEDQRQAPVSPYGRSKLMVEEMLSDFVAANPRFRFAALRYFNAAGCAMDGTLGEDHDPETHLIPVVLQSILGQRPTLSVFGTDYPTPDGTNIRDYVHVDDLADAHIRAMEQLRPGETIFANLGTGQGFSVKEIISVAERVTGRKVPVEYGPRRPGDAVALYASSDFAKRRLGWIPQYKDPETIVGSAWNWFKDHPNGYADKA
jgi:UDP-glucose 4-epimerase